MEYKQMLEPGQEKEIPQGQLAQIGLSWAFYGQNYDLDLTAIKFTNFLFN